MLEIQNCNVTIMISDMDRSIEFYAKVLGFKLNGRYGDHWADLSGPGISIGLHPTKAKIVPSGNLQIALRVQDLKQAMAHLEANGIECTTNSDANIDIASFTDPDGNGMYLVQPKW